MKWFVVAILLFMPSSKAAATDSCPVALRVHASSHGTAIAIDGTRCEASLDRFWRVVEESLPRPLPQGLTWLSLMGPAGADQRTAMSAAWRNSCNFPTGQATAFLQAYKLEAGARVLAPSLAKLMPVPDSVDNFYVVKRSNGSISHPGCQNDLMTPVIYYRLSAPNR